MLNRCFGNYWSQWNTLFEGVLRVAGGVGICSAYLNPGSGEAHSVDTQRDGSVHHVLGEGDKVLRPEAEVAAVR